MNPYIKITATTFTTWILTSFINGLICGVYLAIIHKHPSQFAGLAILIFFLSLIFSSIGYFILWMILVITFGNGVYNRALFRRALSAGFMLAISTGIIGLKIFEYELHCDKYVIVLFVVSAMLSIMIHFNQFKKIN